MHTNQPCFALKNVFVLGFDIQVQMCDRCMKGTAETAMQSWSNMSAGRLPKGLHFYLVASRRARLTAGENPQFTN